MLVLDPLRGVRVVATPEALDAAPWESGVVVLRLAPDEALALGVREVHIADDHAIVELETGLSGAWFSTAELSRRVLPCIDWPLHEGRPALAQGLVCGVPAKLWLEDDRALLLCHAAFAHELAERI